MNRPLIAMLTDFGIKDHYVGVMKGVMKRICPAAEFIDITHDIPPQDVRAAAYMLATNYMYFPEGTVFLVVVDPGVGLQRKPIAVDIGDYTFVAPDNGVLSYVLAQHKPLLSVEITEGDRISRTFHGRDVFAPTAADIASGEKLYEIGAIISDGLNLYPKPQLKEDKGIIIGEVIYIDHFGNVVTSIGDCLWLDDETLQLKPRFYPEMNSRPFSVYSELTIAGETFTEINRTYGDAPRGSLMALVGSNDFLEFAVNQGNAAQRLDVKVGDPVTIIPKQERR
ncbi:MAG: SAM-dependent chlorinase/fluorinase [Chloroflexota bacterium]